jgi:threonyl-tRNA synthetase
MSDDRKTPEQRAQMSDIERLRHSAAHVLATAILRIWPEAQFAAGPPVENGFYYDVELPHRISPDDFAQIEAEMKKETKANHTFERVVVSRGEALALAEAGELGGLGPRPEASKFKLDIIQNIPEGEEISLYRNGEFTDLCAGPHVMRTGNIGAFKLTNVASAYYKGDEKNPQLQRIYGTAFKNRTELDAYFAMLEEAKKRDHRKLGKELELFTFDDDVGPASALAPARHRHHRGTREAGEGDGVCCGLCAGKDAELSAGVVVQNERPSTVLRRLDVPADGAARVARSNAAQNADEAIANLKLVFPDFEQLLVEHEEIEGLIELGRSRIAELPADISDLIETESLRQVILRITQRKAASVAERYYLKAMNCPHHHKLYDALPRSYRDLPLRLAEYGTCHRYEQSGELFGLMRVRSLQMNDAHIYCTPEQFESEFRAVNEMYLKYFTLFGIEKYVMRFSTHDPARLGQKFVNEPELWQQTEEMVRGVLQRSGINYVEVPNEAAFYGPKIDVQVWSAIGREFTIATNQVDFAQPKRFGLTYKTRDNTDAMPLCIHRAPLGTHERFIGFLIEHYAGNFPLWLSPEQVRVLPIGNEEPLVEYARAIQQELRASGVRAELDPSNDHIKAKISAAEQMKVHTMLVIGGRDMEANAVSVRLHGKGNIGAKPRDEAIAELLRLIEQRAAN